MTSLSSLYPVILPVPEADQHLKGRDKVKALSRLARVALRQSCQKSGLRLDRLPKNGKGAPLPVNGVHWSLTHKSDMVGGVAALLAVGMDLETIRPVNDALMNKVAGGAEWRLVRGERQRNFFRFWTAKEAVLKAVGKGIGGLNDCRVVEVVDDHRLVLTYAENDWPVALFWFEGHVAAITAYRSQVCWTLVP